MLRWLLGVVRFATLFVDRRRDDYGGHYLNRHSLSPLLGNIILFGYSLRSFIHVFPPPPWVLVVVVVSIPLSLHHLPFISRRATINNNLQNSPHHVTRDDCAGDDVFRIF